MTDYSWPHSALTKISAPNPVSFVLVDGADSAYIVYILYIL